MRAQMKRRVLANEVAACLFTAEDSLDVTFAALGELVTAVPRVRKEAGVSALVAQEAIAIGAEALSDLAVVRGKIAEMHRRLDAAKDEVGLRHVAIGGDVDKPPRPKGLAAVA